MVGEAQPFGCLLAALVLTTEQFSRPSQSAKLKSHRGEGTLPLRMRASIAIERWMLLAESRDEDGGRNRMRQSEM